LPVPYRNVRDVDKLQRLLGAIFMIEADVDLADLLTHLVQEACALVGARYGALGVLNEARTSLAQFITHGLSEDEEAALGNRPTGRGVLGLVIADPQPLRLDDVSQHPLSCGVPEGHPPMTSFLGVPVRTKSAVYGNLYLTDKVDAVRFSDEDESLVAALALAAGVAIEGQRLNERVRFLSVIDDRDRIARELHDRIIQRIYAVGLSLEEATRLAPRDEVIASIDRGVGQLDIVINELRAAIHDLGGAPLPGGIRLSVTDLVEELVPILGPRPRVEFRGPVDTVVPPRLGDHVIAVLREALTNVSKHARAHEVTVRLSVGDGHVVLEVADDGVGLGGAGLDDGHGMGLENMGERARRLGGRCRVEPAEPRGTVVTWTVPLGTA
jgi:two-component system, NarL family, sensor histidine kinase DevS